MKKQIVAIHGGETFASHKAYLDHLRTRGIDLDRFRGVRRDWKQTLGERLGDQFDVLALKMPSGSNAKYAEWKLWFERIAPHLEAEVSLVGHSLGGVFLAKYLSENEFPRKIAAVFLIAAPHDDKDSEYSLSGFRPPENLSKFEKQAGAIFLYHSKDDEVVPLADLHEYTQVLRQAIVRVLEDRGHFNDEEFPELVRDIRSLVSAL